MALIKEELEIIGLEDLLKMNLKIPVYQRPYNWSNKSVNTLFMDIYSAYKNNMAEYRIGSVILHKDGNVYNVVDGQQRITTITILLLCFKDKSGLIDVEFSRLSERAIIKNHQILQRKVKEIDEDKEAFKNICWKNAIWLK